MSSVQLRAKDAGINISWTFGCGRKRFTSISYHLAMHNHGISQGQCRLISIDTDPFDPVILGCHRYPWERMDQFLIASDKFQV